MNIRKNIPPATVERGINIDLTRDEVLTALSNYVKIKTPGNYRLNDMATIADEYDKLEAISVSGVEIVGLTWKEPVTPPATPPVASEIFQEKEKIVINPEDIK